MNTMYLAIIISLINMYSFATFEPLSNLGRNILQSSESAAHDLASKAIDAAKITKNRTEEALHHPKSASNMPKEISQPIINKHHPHLRTVNNRYTQVR